MMRRAALAALAMSLGSAVAAQEMDFTNTIAGDFAMIGIQHEVLNRSLGIDDGPTRKPGSTGQAARRPGYFAPVRPGAAAPSFRYQRSPALWQETSQQFVARIARQDPGAAKIIAGEMARVDFGKAYADFVRPFGLRPDDAADALTAYTVLGWTIVADAPNPSPRQVAGVRAQIAQRAASNPSFADPRARARLGEELKLQFVTLQAGWQSAHREGKVRQYRDGVAGLFGQSGVDLRALRLGERGFTGS